MEKDYLFFKVKQSLEAYIRRLKNIVPNQIRLQIRMMYYFQFVLLLDLLTLLHQNAALVAGWRLYILWMALALNSFFIYLGL